MKTFRPARKRIDVSVGESVRILRELQGYSQNELAKLTGIPQATLSAIENDRVRLGVERAKILARALRCHPAVLVFPGWAVTQETAAESGSQGGRPPQPPHHRAGGSALGGAGRRVQ
jgi:transcriptional regulator with XRE-family HTH domain